MSVQRKLAHLASLTILASAVLASAAASAEDLPCVQQAIDFNKYGNPNEVYFSAVASTATGSPPMRRAFCTTISAVQLHGALVQRTACSPPPSALC